MLIQCGINCNGWSVLEQLPKNTIILTINVYKQQMRHYVFENEQTPLPWLLFTLLIVDMKQQTVACLLSAYTTNSNIYFFSLMLGNGDFFRSLIFSFIFFRLCMKNICVCTYFFWGCSEKCLHIQPFIENERETFLSLKPNT